MTAHKGVLQGPICRGGWGGVNPPNDFLTPRISVDLSSWGSILTPVLVLHVSACGASTLSPVGDPPMFFLQIGHWSFIFKVLQKYKNTPAQLTA